MKYLIIKCEALNDQWECDADRKPVCMTDNYDDYCDFGYEVYELLEDGTFKLIKEYTEEIWIKYLDKIKKICYNKLVRRLREEAIKQST